MNQGELLIRINELEKEIAILPAGSITKKKISDKEYYYHRITRNGKRVENYLAFEQVPELKSQIALRKSLEKELKELKKQIIPDKTVRKEEPFNF